MSWRPDVQWYDFSTDVANETIISAISQVAESLGMRKVLHAQGTKNPGLIKIVMNKKRRLTHL